SLRVHDLYLCRTCQKLGRSGLASHWPSREISRVRPKRKLPRTATRITAGPTANQTVVFSPKTTRDNADSILFDVNPSHAVRCQFRCQLIYNPCFFPLC